MPDSSRNFELHMTLVETCVVAVWGLCWYNFFERLVSKMGYGISDSPMMTHRVDTPMKTVIWGFPKMGVPQNGRFLMENPMKMDDLGIPLFQEATIWDCQRVKMGFRSERWQDGLIFGPELEPTCAMVKSWIGVHNPYWGILIPPLIPINIITHYFWNPLWWWDDLSPWFLTMAHMNISKSMFKN